MDPDATLLEQATAAAQRQGTLDATLEADTATQAITGEASLGVTHRETWGEWFARVALRGTAKRDAKPTGSAKVEFGARWLVPPVVVASRGLVAAAVVVVGGIVGAAVIVAVVLWAW